MTKREKNVVHTNFTFRIIKGKKKSLQRIFTSFMT